MASIDLRNRHLLVIGGSGSIGRAVIRSAAAAGAAITATSSSGKAAGELDGIDAAWVPLDLTEHGATERVLDDVPTESGPITDIVVAAAARPFDSLAEMSGDDLRALVDTKLWGAFHVGRAAADRLPDDGTLTFISGLLAAYPDAAAPVAAVSAAIDALGRGLAVELAPRRVNVVSPAALGSAGRIGHQGTPADVADAILATITNPWMSGTVVELHGAGRP